MGAPARPSPARILAGVVACGCLVALVGLVLPLGELRCPAVVDASQTFSLASLAPGQYQCTLRDGRPPGVQGLVSQELLQYERDDLVEMRLDPGLRTGAAVSVGQTLATVRSLHHQQALGALRAQRAAIGSRRALLVAGGLPAGVETARREVAVAEAERVAGRAQLERLRLLSTSGLVSEEELDAARLEDEVRRRRVEAAQAGVELARNPPQPPALEELDALVEALDASIVELERLLDEEEVICPIDGVVELGAVDAELKVHRLDPVFLDLPLPAAARSRVVLGSPVLFTTVVVPGTVFRGVLVEVAPSSDSARGGPVFWSSVEIANPDGLLRRGMTGTALIRLDGGDPGALSKLRLGVWRLLS